MRSLVNQPRSPPSAFEPGSFEISAATLAKSSPPLIARGDLLRVGLVLHEDVAGVHLLLGLHQLDGLVVERVLGLGRHRLLGLLLEVVVEQELVAEIGELALELRACRRPWRPRPPARRASGRPCSRRAGVCFCASATPAAADRAGSSAAMARSPSVIGYAVDAWPATLSGSARRPARRGRRGAAVPGRGRLRRRRQREPACASMTASALGAPEGAVFGMRA